MLNIFVLPYLLVAFYVSTCSEINLNHFFPFGDNARGSTRSSLAANLDFTRINAAAEYALFRFYGNLRLEFTVSLYCSLIEMFVISHNSRLEC